MARQERIDVLLVQRGLAESRSQAQRLVMAGQVRVEGQLIHKPSRKIAIGAKIQIESGPRYVSRGGEKLAEALEAFVIQVEGRICADVGASTGGFTDCLLQHGAKRVYAIDVGRGLLHWRVRQDPRVVVMEGNNARTLKSLAEPVDLITIDASFISLRLLLPVVLEWLSPVGEIIALIKPQFEAGKGDVGRGGVVRDPAIHKRVIIDVIDCIIDLELAPQGLHRSPIQGPKGNIEFLVWCKQGGTAVDTQTLLDGVEL